MYSSFSYEIFDKVPINLCQHGTAFCLFETSIVFILLPPTDLNILLVLVVLLSKIPHGGVDIQCRYALCKLKLRSIGSQGFNFIFTLLCVFVYIHDTLYVLSYIW